MSGLQALDIAMLALLAASLLIGAWRGLVYELAALGSWVVAYVVAVGYGGAVGPYLPIGQPGSALNQAAALVLTFLVTLIACGLVARLLRALIAATPLTLPDRVLGAAFGLTRGVVLLVVLATVVTLTPAAQSSWWRESLGARWLGVAIEGMRPLLPEDIARWLPRPSVAAN